jgi:hypothetical protein
MERLVTKKMVKSLLGKAEKVSESSMKITLVDFYTSLNFQYIGHWKTREDEWHILVQCNQNGEIGFSRFYGDIEDDEGKSPPYIYFAPRDSDESLVEQLNVVIGEKGTLYSSDSVSLLTNSEEGKEKFGDIENLSPILRACWKAHRDEPLPGKNEVGEVFELDLP